MIYYIDRNNKSSHLCDFMLLLIATLFKKLIAAVLIGMVRMRVVADNSSIMAAVNNHYTKGESSHSATTTPDTRGASLRLGNRWHYHNGLSTATHRCYLTEQQHYIQSCNEVNQISDSYI